MFFDLLGGDVVLWLSLLAVASGSLTRTAKAKWKTMPKSWLPWFAVVAAYVLATGDMLLRGHELPEAMRIGLGGLAAGVGAPGLHELAKKVLEPRLGTEMTERILGKLQERAKQLPPAPPSKSESLTVEPEGYQAEVSPEPEASEESEPVVSGDPEVTKP